jgi:hypothetical protein
MSFLDDARKKLTETVNTHGDKLKDGLDRAGRTIDQKTDGRYTDKIQRGTKAAGDALDNLRDDAVDPAGDPAVDLAGDPAIPTPDPNAPTPPTAPPDRAPGEDPGGVSEPGTPSDPAHPTG